MNVLLLTQVLPYPPDSGPTVKTWNVLKHLARTHRVTLASFVRGDQRDAIRHLEQHCHAVHTVPMRRSRLRDASALVRSFATGEPFVIVRDDRAAMHQLVARLTLATRFDVVHADQVNMAPYAARVRGARVIFDAHNALWLAMRRLSDTRPRGPVRRALQREWRALRRYEGALCRQFDTVLAVSQADRAALEEAAGVPLRARVIPIAIDTQEVRPIARRPEGDDILHIGTLLWPPNADGVLWFLGEVWPLIRAQRPRARLAIAGARPPRSVTAAAARHADVEVAGFVPELTPRLQRAAALVIPLRAGAGMRVRILNGLAQELPIVTTTLGCEGIDVVHGQHLLIADSPAEFAAATVRLLADPNEATAMGRRGRALIESRYDFRTVCAALDDVYAAVQAG